MGLLDDIIAHGNRQLAPLRAGPNWIECRDGFRVSVIAGFGCYCLPRHGWGGASEDYSGPYHAVEVGFPSARPEPWDEWRQWVEDEDEPTETVYSFVPVEAVRRLVELHGGEK